MFGMKMSGQAWPVLPHDDEFVDIFAWREIVEEKLFTNAS